MTAHLLLTTAAGGIAVLPLDRTVHRYIEEAPEVVLGVSLRAAARARVIPLAILPRCGSQEGTPQALLQRHARLRHRNIREKATPIVAVLLPGLHLLPGLDVCVHT
jgi:hypothetical protein